MPNIEDGFRPDTVNEVLLLNRIHELLRKLWEKGWGAANYENHDPFETNVSYPAPMTLRLAAEVESGWDDPAARFYIRARSYGPGKASLGHQYYMPPQSLSQLSPTHAANVLGGLHQQLIRNLAKVISE